MAAQKDGKKADDKKKKKADASARWFPLGAGLADAAKNIIKSRQESIDAQIDGEQKPKK